MILNIVTLLASGALSALVVHALRPAAFRLALLDAPGGRKRHEGAIPLIGGVAVILSFLVNALVFLPAISPYKALMVSLIVLLVVGVLDDLHELSAREKLVFQIITAVLVTSWGGIYLWHFGDLLGLGVLELGNWAIPVSIFAVLSVVNAYNMSDGIDGLVGGWSFVTLMMISFLAQSVGLVPVSTLALVLGGAVGGFLLFNLRHPWRARATVFLGDAGSMTLGLAIAWLSIELTQARELDHGVPPVVMLWVLGLVLIDMFAVTLRRIVKRRNPLRPDRTHLHHVLLRVGFSQHSAVFFLISVNISLALLGIGMWLVGVPDVVSFVGFLALTLLYILASRRAWRLARRMRVWFRLAASREGP